MRTCHHKFSRTFWKYVYLTLYTYKIQKLNFGYNIKFQISTHKNWIEQKYKVSLSLNNFWKWWEMFSVHSYFCWNICLLTMVHFRIIYRSEFFFLRTPRNVTTTTKITNSEIFVHICKTVCHFGTMNKNFAFRNFCISSSCLYVICPSSYFEELLWI